MAGTERAAHAHHAREIGRYLVSYDDIGVNEYESQSDKVTRPS